MSCSSDDSWESWLFHPPPWPYSKDDAAAPTAHPTITRIGYDSRQLGALSVQSGYTPPPPPSHSSPASGTEARQYYTQFQVFRDVMLGKYWVDNACPQTAGIHGEHARDSRHRPKSPGSTRHQRLSPSPHLSPANTVQADDGQQGFCCDKSQPRSLSTDSAETAVALQSSGAAQASLSPASRSKPLQPPDSGAKRRGRPRPESRPSSAGVSPGKTFAILRIPLLVAVLLVVAIELALYFSIRQLVAAYEQLFIWRGDLGRLFLNLCSARSYREYMGFARLIDSHLGVSLEDTGVHARYYDAPLLLRITESLRESRLLVEGLAHQHNADGVKKGGADIEDLARSTMLSLCDILRQGALKANAGGWENRQIWSRAYSGTVQVVENYIAEVVACIECVRASPYLQAKEKLALFRQVARQQGRTALCLSGGASMGWKHLGVARCLLDEARLPRVISGTSAGALVAALLGTYTDDELRQIVRPEFAKYMTACQGSSWTKLARWITKGHYFDAVEWAPRAQVFTRGSTTFLEAFERTGKVLNISCTPVGHRYSPPKLLNYITAPNVIIWSAVLASACLPGVMQPMVLLMKTHDGRIVPYTNSGALWRDGSFRNDIPSRDLRASLNVQFTVVSQVNPHVTLFFYDRDGSIGRPPARRYSSMWRGGFVFSAIEHMLKLDIRKWLRILCDLNLVPLVLKQDWSFVWLQKFDGEITILPKARVSDYLRLLLDPTSESLKQNMEAGKVATWPKLKMIRTRQAIEDAIIGGWLEAYHECARSTRQLQAVPLWMAMEAAKMAKPAKWMYTQQKQHGQPFGEAEESHPDVWNAPTPRPKSTSPSPSQGGQAHRASRRARHYLRHSSTPPFTAPVGSRTNKHYLKLAIEGGEHGSSCSSSATEDAWTGYTC